MDLIEKNIRPRDIVTRKSLENAARVVPASGGSTNAGLHLPAIAHEAGIDFDLEDVCEIFKRHALHRRPQAGWQICRQGPVRGRRRPAVIMKALLDGGYLHGDCITVTGKTIGREPGRCEFPTDQKVHLRPSRRAVDPLSADRRRRRPEGQSGARGRDREGRRHGAPWRSPAARRGQLVRLRGRRFQGGAGARYKEGEVIVIRYEGPKGGPGMREMCRHALLACLFHG